MMYQWPCSGALRAIFILSGVGRGGVLGVCAPRKDQQQLGKNKTGATGRSPKKTQPQPIWLKQKKKGPLGQPQIKKTQTFNTYYF